ncbi:MAG TPA: hypothetical protein VF940_10435 [Streptosporangiaceae bacterium]
MTELEELALDPLVPPAMVLGGEPLDERGDHGADRRPASPVRRGPRPGGQAPVPPQQSAGRDQAADGGLTAAANPAHRGPAIPPPAPA